MGPNVSHVVPLPVKVPVQSPKSHSTLRTPASSPMFLLPAKVSHRVLRVPSPGQELLPGPRHTHQDPCSLAPVTLRQEPPWARCSCASSRALAPSRLVSVVSSSSRSASRPRTCLRYWSFSMRLCEYCSWMRSRLWMAWEEQAGRVSWPPTAQMGAAVGMALLVRQTLC